MLRDFPFTTLVTAFSLIVYFVLSFLVGKARGTYKVPAPATDGPPEFQRVFRVQMNTLEQIVFFLPSLWLFALTWGDGKAALIGVIWPLARILYARSYYAAAEKRGPGFGLTVLSAAVLLVGAIVGAVQSLL